MANKILILFAFTLLLTTSKNAQTNMSFELWASSLTSDYEPIEWGTLNADAFIFAISHTLITSTFQEISNPGQGLSSVKLITKSGYNSSYFSNVFGKDTLGGVVSLGFTPYLGVPLGVSYTQKPISVDLMYKSDIIAGDTGVFLVQLSHWDGSQRITDGDAMMLFAGNVSTWSTISLPLTYYTSSTPDTLLILASSSASPWLDNIGGPSPLPLPGSELIIDNIILNNACPPPIANFTHMAMGPSVAFFDSSSTTGLATYSWNFGDGGTSFLPSPIYFYTSPGTYNVCLIVTDSCGSDTACQNIIIGTACPPPTSFFMASSVALSASFTDMSITNGPTTYSWDFGDGSGTSTLQNPSYTYSASGIYNVCLLVSDSCDIDSICLPVTIIDTSLGCPPPIPFFMSVPNGLMVSFSDLSAITGSTTYSWDFGDGVGTSTQQNPSYTYSVAGLYNVCLFISDSCDTASSCLPVLVIDTNLGCPPPIPLFMAVPNGLTASFTDLSATTGSTTYSWDFGDGSGTSTQQNPSYTYSVSGLYNVCLLVSDSCDTGTICLPIIVFDSINNILNLSIPDAFCQIFPNPANNKINFLFQEVINPGVILIYNNLGSLIKSIPYQDTFIEINTSVFSDGMYYYNIVTNSTILSSGKFIIQKE